MSNPVSKGKKRKYQFVFCWICPESARVNPLENNLMTNVTSVYQISMYLHSLIRVYTAQSYQSIRVTTWSNELLVWLGIEDLELILKERRLRWYGHVERSNGAVRTAFTYRLMESVGLGGPKWHGSSWQRGIAESGSSQLSTLMIDVPGDQVWDLPCVQQARYLEWGPLMWMLPLYLHVNQKSDYDDDDMILSVNRI